MASNQVLNVEQLLSPISDSAPSGENLRGAGTEYRHLKDVRARARMVERKKGEQDPEYADRMPEWAAIMEQVPPLLQSRSKDLELASWLTEALVREHGFAGLRDGMRLLRELADRFWDTVYPLPDEDGAGTRAGPIGGLSGDASGGTLIEPLWKITIISSRDGNDYSIADYKQASDLQEMPDETRQRRVDGGAVTLARLQQAAAQTPPAFFKGLLEDLSACRDECRQLENVLAGKCGNDADGNAIAPSCGNIVAILDGAVAAVHAVGGGRVATTVATAQKSAAAATGAGITPLGGGNVDWPSASEVVVAGSALSPAGMPSGREAAFEQVLLIAEYFRRSEPQGVVSYALEQAVKWGRMPLPELVARFVPDSSARTRFNWIGVGPSLEENTAGGSESGSTTEGSGSDESAAEPEPVGVAALFAKR